MPGTAKCGNRFLYSSAWVLVCGHKLDMVAFPAGVFCSGFTTSK